MPFRRFYQQESLSLLKCAHPHITNCQYQLNRCTDLILMITHNKIHCGYLGRNTTLNIWKIKNQAKKGKHLSL